MKKTITGHLLSILFVSTVFAGFIFYFQSDQNRTEKNKNDQISEFLDYTFLDYNSPLDRALLQETLDQFYPKQDNHKIIDQIISYKKNELNQIITGEKTSHGISAKKLLNLSGMYFNFIIVYLIVLILTYYGVQTLGVYLFIMNQQTALSNENNSVVHLLVSPLKKIGSFFIYLTLFSPAYVVAYSIKTKVDTDSFIFMILLGITTNGLLAIYAHKFYMILVSESRKGYVQTSIVKNLETDYGRNYISLKSVFKFKKSFHGHILHDIYKNSHFQYISSVKEQASFIISGLIIIEMALNIQGHFCYELLQQLLYKNYSVAILIIYGIFLLVKLTEIAVDFLFEKETRKFSNSAGSN